MYVYIKMGGSSAVTSSGVNLQLLYSVCMFDLILYVPVNNFSVMSGRVTWPD